IGMIDARSEAFRLKKHPAGHSGEPAIHRLAEYAEWHTEVRQVRGDGQSIRARAYDPHIRCLNHSRFPSFQTKPDRRFTPLLNKSSVRLAVLERFPGSTWPSRRPCVYPRISAPLAAAKSPVRALRERRKTLRTRSRAGASHGRPIANKGSQDHARFPV